VGVLALILWGGISTGKEIAAYQATMEAKVFAPIQKLLQAADVQKNRAEYITEYGDYIPGSLGVSQSGIMANNLTASAQDLMQYFAQKDKALVISSASKSRLESKLGKLAFWRTLSKGYNLQAVQDGFLLFTPEDVPVKKQEQQLSVSFQEDGYETEGETYWCTNDFTLQIVNPYATPTAVQVAFSAAPAVWEENNTFTLQCGKKQKTSFILSEDMSGFTADLLLQPGVNEIVFHTSAESDPDSLSDIERYFALSGFTIKLRSE